MKDFGAGLIISVVLHLGVAALFLSLPAGTHKYKHELLKTVPVHLVFFAGQGREAQSLTAGAGKRAGEPRKKQGESGRTATRAHSEPRGRGGASVSAEAPRTTAGSPQGSLKSADPQGDTPIHGGAPAAGAREAAAAATSVGAGEDPFSPPGYRISGGHGTGAVGPGRGGEGFSKADLSYVRGAVHGNIRYPEKARRRGIEGRVELSFVILENGTTSDIKVVGTSTHWLLEESAKEAVARTRIRKAVPFNRRITFNVFFSLNGSTVVD